MIREYTQSIVRHIMTIVVGLNLVSEGETIPSAITNFIDNLGAGDTRALITAGLVVITLVWSAIEKKHHDDEIETLTKKCEGK